MTTKFLMYRYQLAGIFALFATYFVMAHAEARPTKLPQLMQVIASASAPSARKVAACSKLSKLGVLAYVALPLLKQAHRYAKGKYKAALAAALKRIQDSAKALHKKVTPLGRACRKYRLQEEVNIKLPNAYVIEKATVIERLRNEAKVRYRSQGDMNALYTRTTWVDCKQTSKDKGYILKSHPSPQKTCKPYPVNTTVKLYIDIADPRTGAADDEKAKGVVLAHDYNGNKALVRFRAIHAGKMRTLTAWFICKPATYHPHSYFIRGKVPTKSKALPKSK